MVSTLKVLEILVLYPAESYNFRLESGKEEPIPPPWTLSKLSWGLSLVWSYRGIGWNYSCNLPYSFLAPPYSRTSSRRDFLWKAVGMFVLVTLVDDLTRTLMNLSPASSFFSLPRKIGYIDLTQWERGVCSTLVLIRIWRSVEWYYLLIIICVPRWDSWDGR